MTIGCSLALADDPACGQQRHRWGGWGSQGGVPAVGQFPQFSVFVSADALEKAGRAC